VISKKCAHWSLSVSSLDQRRVRPFFLLDWLDLDCFVGWAGLVGEAGLGLVTRLTDRTSASKIIEATTSLAPPMS
jgi:hypothetical protein